MKLKLYVMLAVSAVLSGCATLEAGLTNRATASAAMYECRVDSRWGGFGISTKLDNKDCQVLLEGMLARIERMLREAAAPKKTKAEDL